MSPFWVRLTSPLWVPVIAGALGLMAAFAIGVEMMREVWS